MNSLHLDNSKPKKVISFLMCAGYRKLCPLHYTINMKEANISLPLPPPLVKKLVTIRQMLKKNMKN